MSNIQNTLNRTAWWMSILTIVLWISSCHTNQRLERALEFAGSNRQELEKVLEYYQDSGLKYEAARFLIENMPVHYAYRGAGVDSVKAALAGRRPGHKASESEAAAHWDKYGAEKVYDARVITADYLMANIERAFRAWKKRPWNRHLPFEEFCEWILPYRVGTEPLERWWEPYERQFAFLLDSVYQGTDVVVAADTVCRYLGIYRPFDYDWSLHYPFQLGASFLLEHPTGSCREACDRGLYVMRALGIPVAMDYYLLSSQRRAGHTWDVVRDTTGEFWGLWLEKNKVQRGSIYSDGEKSGKVYRRLFGKPYSRDASADYFPDTLLVRVPGDDRKAVWLGISHAQQGWVPVASAPVQDGMAVFPHVEADFDYILLGQDDKGGYFPLDVPFCFDGEEVHPYQPDYSKRDTVVLYRKLPLYSNYWNFLDCQKGVVIDFSDDAGFSHITYSFRMDSVPYSCHNHLLPPKGLKSRFVRYRAPAGKCIQLAELQMYNQGKQLNAIDIQGNGRNFAGYPIENAIDNDVLTAYSSSDEGAVFWIDLGCIQPIDSVAFVARSDDNFIRPGDTYELFYFAGTQEGWVSLGQRRAKMPYLEYDNVPQNALFHLRCLTRGVEEMVFHIENGKQSFWSNSQVEL